MKAHIDAVTCYGVGPEHRLATAAIRVLSAPGPPGWREVSNASRCYPRCVFAQMKAGFP